ncbi:hypothetical protein DNTS_031769 [Danionella cerebrum]|uniref:Myeloid leukemia factor 1 n=1 Tax=Danionella cerebrum TaxID=2873325 RepID=A0A553MYS8_9TELE|nr:hypothetical protein DNTS_031769 [Danionella translucida]
MMRGFSDPFMPSITDGHRRGPRGQANSNHNHHRDHELDFFSNPFSMMENMRNRMDAMHRNFDSMGSDSGGHSFSSSSVVTYSKVGNEPPKVFQASSQTRRAPGGIKETRKCLRDSESGLQKMSIGHHIQDRGHVIERKENTEAQSFDQEWQREVSRFQAAAPLNRLDAPRHRSEHRAAIKALPDTHRDARAAEGHPTHYIKHNVKGSDMKKH